MVIATNAKELEIARAVKALGGILIVKTTNARHAMGQVYALSMFLKRRLLKIAFFLGLDFLEKLC